MQLGFVGLGAMGLPMTRHLLEAGHQVTVASRSRGPIDRAVALGAVDGRRSGAVADAADVVFLCVPSSPQVVEVVAAMLPVLGPGTVVVDCSTIDPEVTRDQHTLVTVHRCRLPRRPALGGTAGAEAGTLTLMVGGDEATLGRVRPALDPFAGRDRPRRRPGDGPGGEALQQPDLRRPDAGHRRGHRPGPQVRGRPDPSSSRSSPTPPATAWPSAPGCRSPASCPTARPRTGGSRDS